MNISDFDEIHSLVAQLFLDWKIGGFQTTLIHTHTHNHTHIFIRNHVTHFNKIFRKRRDTNGSHTSSGMRKTMTTCRITLCVALLITTDLSRTTMTSAST